MGKEINKKKRGVYMNPFDDFDLDMVKITNAKQGLRSCDDPLNGSTSGSSVIQTFTCHSACVCLTDITDCPSACNACSEDPKCQTLEGRCE